MPEPYLESYLRRLGYKWIKQTPEEVGKMIADMLNKKKAECYLLDTYTGTGDRYRTINISWKDYSGLIRETLKIAFNPDTGSNFTVDYQTEEVRSEHLNE